MTNDTNAQRLAEIDEREKTATEGYWEIESYLSDCGWDKIGQRYKLVIPDGLWKIASIIADFEREADVIFCANARQDIPWMSARIKALEARLDVFREVSAQSERRSDLLEAVNNLKDRRIAALENAARRCESCTGHKNTGDEPQCVECRARGIGFYPAWVFDERRFAQKGR